MSELALQGQIRLLRDQQAVQDDTELARDGDDGALLGVLAATGSDALSEAAQIRILSERPKDVLGALHEQAAYERIAFLTDSQLGCGLSGVALRWYEAKVSPYLPAFGEPLWVPEAKHGKARRPEP